MKEQVKNLQAEIRKIQEEIKNTPWWGKKLF